MPDLPNTPEATTKSSSRRSSSSENTPRQDSVGQQMGAMLNMLQDLSRKSDERDKETAQLKACVNKLVTDKIDENTRKRSGDDEIFGNSSAKKARIPNLPHHRLVSSLIPDAGYIELAPAEVRYLFETLKIHR